MESVTSIVLQCILLALALTVTILRCWVRLAIERRSLTVADYLVWPGMFCAFGWFSCTTRALYLLIDHPLEDGVMSDSVEYLKLVFAAIYIFDAGLYFPKASLVAFYWWLVPRGFRRLRVAVYVTAAIVACTFIATILTDTFIAPKVSDNWSIENQLNSTWNAYTTLLVDWTLNFGTDLLLFALPFFIFSCLKLRTRQKIGLVVIFSLGLITMAISLSRFIVYNLDYVITEPGANLWATAEMCTAISVASLPSLKPLIIKPTPPESYDRSNSGYIHAGFGKTIGSKSIVHSSNVQGGTLDDDEMELTFLDRKDSPTPTGATDEMRAQDGKDAVIVTRDFTVTRDAL